MIDALALLDAFKDLLAFRGAFRGHQNAERATDDLLGRIAVELLRTHIPGQNVSINAFANDRIVG